MNCEIINLDTIINLIDTKYFNSTTGVLTIPDGVEEINGKFYFRRKDTDKLYKVKEIRIPNSVKKIGKYAFRRTGISSIKLPESVKEIETGAFELCKDLIEVSIEGDHIPIVEQDSFIACENLERFVNELGDIDIKMDFRISNKAFSTCYKLLNNKNKWLLVVSEKENNFKKFFNKLVNVLAKVLSYNGMENIKNKF